jgi:hypothetical protein
MPKHGTSSACGPAIATSSSPYPWPGDEDFVERIFTARASNDALLLTFHDFDRILAQRKIADGRELETVDWL